MRCTFIFDQTPLKEVHRPLKQLSGEFDIDNLDLIITLIESALDVNIMKISSIPVRSTG